VDEVLDPSIVTNPGCRIDMNLVAISMFESSRTVQHTNSLFCSAFDLA
jgi:hypothetical protein